ncbi:hypothetical protein B0H13DRAFT_2311619 [Mycena leptocephala]|nr:hypothetical protein B0H13DRAFT_2311619 [Mycena leptocephala]
MLRPHFIDVVAAFASCAYCSFNHIIGGAALGHETQTRILRVNGRLRRPVYGLTRTVTVPLDINPISPTHTPSVSSTFASPRIVLAIGLIPRLGCIHPPLHFHIPAPNSLRPPDGYSAILVVLGQRHVTLPHLLSLPRTRKARQVSFSLPYPPPTPARSTSPPTPFGCSSSPASTASTASFALSLLHLSFFFLPAHRADQHVLTPQIRVLTRQRGRNASDGWNWLLARVSSALSSRLLLFSRATAPRVSSPSASPPLARERWDVLHFLVATPSQCPGVASARRRPVDTAQFYCAGFMGRLQDGACGFDRIRICADEMISSLHARAVVTSVGDAARRARRQPSLEQRRKRRIHVSLPIFPWPWARFGLGSCPTP